MIHIDASLLIMITFAIALIAILLCVMLLTCDALRALYISKRRYLGVVPQLVKRVCRACVSVVQSLFHLRYRDTYDDDDDDESSDESSDDVDVSTAALLAMLPAAAVVVDNADEVVRANPSAYALGVVCDDAIVSSRILQAVHQVREHGGCLQCEIQTETPTRFISVTEDHNHNHDDHNYAEQQGSASEQTAVSRPNWLHVTVGRLNRRFVLLLLDDISETVRFAQTRDSFMVNISEQLLDPARVLEQLANTLEHTGIDQVTIRQHAAQVRSASHRLYHMVEDLLLLIKAQTPVTASDSNKLVLFDQLMWVAHEYADRAQAFGISLVVKGDETLVVNGEADQIRIAVSKLVDNALAYSPSGSSVGISLTASPDRAHAIIRVVDRAMGIDPSEQPHIFERFYRGSNHNERTKDGIGLGLAIVKHVALTHHGSASVWSAPGQGSTFSLILPLAGQ